MIPKYFNIAAKILQFNSKQYDVYPMTRYGFPRNWISTQFFLGPEQSEVIQITFPFLEEER